MLHESDGVDIGSVSNENNTVLGDGDSLRVGSEASGDCECGRTDSGAGVDAEGADSELVRCVAYGNSDVAGQADGEDVVCA